MRADKLTNRSKKDPRRNKKFWSHNARIARRPPRAFNREQSKEESNKEDLILSAQKTNQRIGEWLASSKNYKDAEPFSPVKSAMELDDWQMEALLALKNGENVVVDAPTTAGKTRVVEAFFSENIYTPNFRAAYTTPVKSLSNDKLYEFGQMFGQDNVGIATGDVKENIMAPIVVTTLESYRNSLIGTEPDLGRRFVVYDEYHFLQDDSRGSAWEEAIILTPKNCQILLLSASCGNPRDFKVWLEKLFIRPCRLIKVVKRPVPLKDLIYYQGYWLLKNTYNFPRPKRGIKSEAFIPLEQSKIAKRISKLRGLNLTPCIVYAAQRLACKKLALKIVKEIPPLPHELSEQIREVLLTESEDRGGASFISPNLARMMITYGVAYHHSGIGHPGRVLIEKLVKQGLLQYCVATMGLSLGINFSVRSALVSDYVRPDENGFKQYSASEVLQMHGRAGRRGIDVVGFSLWPNLEAYNRLKSKKRDSCNSKLKNDPTTFLGLMGRGFNLSEIEDFYEKSFLRFNDKRVDLTLIRSEYICDKLGIRSLPCGSPAGSYSLYHDKNQDSACFSCRYRKGCHGYLKKRFRGSLSRLQLHLHQIGCIDNDGNLTSYGNIARYFPQSGGLLLADMIDKGELTESNLLAGLELMACLTLARFKAPLVGNDYRFQFNAQKIRRLLRDYYYPFNLFKEIYDYGYVKTKYPMLKEFNPKGGFLIWEWLRGTSWEDLCEMTVHDKFGQGDLMSLFYRTATYLQSISQINIPHLSKSASYLWHELLRPPLT